MKKFNNVITIFGISRKELRFIDWAKICVQLDYFVRIFIRKTFVSSSFGRPTNDGVSE